MFKLIPIFVLLLSINTYAGKCVFDVTRTACPGKEAESFAKCSGKKAQCIDDKESTGKDREATSEKDCAKKALKACENARTDITDSKIITATFDGKPVEAGKNFCAADRPDFKKCK
ncbi:MAG: hypothetical protein WA160_05415 [Pseudobdellovibrio sp.]